MNTEDYTDWVKGKGSLSDCYGFRCDTALQCPSCPYRGSPAPSHVAVVDPFQENVNAALTEAGALLLRKHNDYGPANISKSPGGPLNGLRVRIHDKTARINNLIDSGVEPENESLRDSFIDLANYAVIALLVLDGKWPE